MGERNPRLRHRLMEAVWLDAGFTDEAGAGEFVDDILEEAYQEGWSEGYSDGIAYADASRPTDDT